MRNLVGWDEGKEHDSVLLKCSCFSMFCFGFFARVFPLNSNKRFIWKTWDSEKDAKFSWQHRNIFMGGSDSLSQGVKNKGAGKQLLGEASGSGEKQSNPRQKLSFVV